MYARAEENAPKNMTDAHVCHVNVSITEKSHPMAYVKGVQTMSEKSISQNIAKHDGRSDFKTLRESIRNTAQFMTERNIMRSPMLPKFPDTLSFIVPNAMTTDTPAADNMSPAAPVRDILSFRKILPNMATKAGAAIIIQLAFPAPAVLIA